MKPTIKLLGDKVLIKPVETDKETGSGLIIPQEARGKSDKADVITVSKHISEEDLKAGDKCFYEKHVGTAFTIEGEKYLVIRIDNIHLIIPQE